MQSCFSPARALRRFLLLCLLPAVFAACDRHPAGEPPESYGHGSSKEKSYTNHDIDSSGDRHFSDSTGVGKEHEHAAAPEKVEAMGAGKRLNPDPK